MTNDVLDKTFQPQSHAQSAASSSSAESSNRTTGTPLNRLLRAFGTGIFFPQTELEFLPFPFLTTTFFDFRVRILLKCYSTILIIILRDSAYILGPASVLPVTPNSSQHTPQDPVSRFDLGASHTAVKHTQLVAQSQVFRLQDGLGFEERRHEFEEEKGELPHDCSSP